MLKKALLILSVIVSFHSFAETVNCTSDDGRWKVSLELTNDSAHNIVFIKNDEVIKEYKNVEVHSFNFWLPGKGKFRYYEIALGGIKYLDIERPIKNKILSHVGEAEFLLTNNPVGFSKYVSCTFE